MVDSHVGLVGLGTALPAGSISQEAAATICGGLVHGVQPETIAALYRRSGVSRRHCVILDGLNDTPPTFYPPADSSDHRGPTTAQRMRRYELEASVLAETSCRRALASADVQPEQVTHLVTVSCTGFAAPGFDLALMSKAGFVPDVVRTHVGFMGCHGLLNGLRVANAFARSDPNAVVVVCAVELCSLHQQYTSEPQQIVANALFADGAAALIVRQAEGTSALGHLCSQRSYVLPDTADMMSWRIGDHGFEMTLSPRVPDIIRSHLKQWLSKWLADCGLQSGEIETWAIHPGGPRILTAVADSVGFDRALLRPSQSVLADYGNMSSPTIAFILERLLRENSKGPCVLLAFGPGLTIEAALIA